MAKIDTLFMTKTAEKPYPLGLLMYRSFPKPPIPSRANPGAFDFCEKFWSNFPLCCQFRQSNTPPVRASKRVKSFIQMYIFCNKQLATVWINIFRNKFCTIFRHYEFLVQLVFAPRFKGFKAYSTI